MCSLGSSAGKPWEPAQIRAFGTFGAAARAVVGAGALWAAGAPFYMQSLVRGTDAVQAFDGFLQFKGVVEKHQVSTVSAPAVVPCGASRRH